MYVCCYRYYKHCCSITGLREAFSLHLFCLSCMLLRYISHNWHNFCSLQTWLLLLGYCLAKWHVTSPSTHSECSCRCCSSQILQSWLYSQIAALKVQERYFHPHKLFQSPIICKRAFYTKDYHNVGQLLVHVCALLFCSVVILRVHNMLMWIIRTNKMMMTMTLPMRSHQSTTSWIHAIIWIGHCLPTAICLWSQDHKLFFSDAATHLWNNLPATIHVPYQSGASSSPSSCPSSGSDFGPLVNPLKDRGVNWLHFAIQI